MTERTLEDEILIRDRFNDLMASCKSIIKDEEGGEMIRKAFMLANEAHKGVQRKSGVPYILHPISVAKIAVTEIGLGVKSVVAALLHDVVEDASYTVEDINTLFGPKIASMVDGLTKMEGVFNSEVSKQAENFRKILIAMSDDIRVILIKLADRLHNMRTMDAMPRDKQIRISSETLYLFAPLAHRLGLYTIKSELEDLGLKYRYPEQYKDIESKLKETEESRNKFIDRLIKPIREALTLNGIECTIAGRVKSIYSIWSKMESKKVGFDEIYDLFAIRIIFDPANNLIPEKAQCWHIYSLITDIYMPKPDRIRDWVTSPKANGYEALHATVMGPDGVWVEVQIRSKRMEDIAERGFASHWKYKQNDHDSDDELDKFIEDVRRALEEPQSAVEFLDNLKLTFYTNEIVVFTPKGEPKKLPNNATALDFAYEIHTNIGNKAIGAKINHKIESIFTHIDNGDQIEIITADNSHPKAEWLEHVATAKARQAITAFLKKNGQNNIEQGIAIFEKRIAEFGIKPSARLFRKLLPAYDCTSKDEFYSKLGSGIINLNDIEEILHQNSKNKILKFWNIEFKKPKNNVADDFSKHKLVVGKEARVEDEVKFVIAKECNPIPGDSIVGYKLPGTNTITVHKAGCKEITRLASQHGENIISDIKWSSHSAESYLSEIEIRGIDRVGILVDLSKVITDELGINIREMSVRSHDGIFEGKISVYVKDIENLSALMKKARDIKGIELIKRVQ